MKKKLTEDLPELIGCVATFNADAYTVETEDQEAEIIEAIAAHGVAEITDADEFADAAAKLDGDENTYIRIFRAGVCIFGELSRVGSVEPDYRVEAFDESGNLQAVSSLFNVDDAKAYAEGICGDYYNVVVSVKRPNGDYTASHDYTNGAHTQY